MDIKLWIISQIIIDIILVGVVLFLFKRRHQRDVEWQNHEMAIEKSGTILAEMEEVVQSLQKNLEEKRELSRHIIEELDQDIQRAEESHRQFSKILGRPERPVEESVSSTPDPKETRASIKALMGKGFTKEEVSQILGVPHGEIELFHKLNLKKGAPVSSKKALDLEDVP